MRRTAIVFCFIFVVSSLAYGQYKMPTFMVVPSTSLWFDNGYISSIGNKNTADYERALKENRSLSVAISSLEKILSDNGLPVKNPKSELGARAKMSVEQLVRAPFMADIFLETEWRVTTHGNSSSFLFNVKCTDNSTEKQILSVNAKQEFTNHKEAIPSLLQMSIQKIRPQLEDQLRRHFQYMQEKRKRMCPLDFYCQRLFNQYGKRIR